MRRGREEEGEGRREGGKETKTEWEGGGTSRWHATLQGNWVRVHFGASGHASLNTR